MCVVAWLLKPSNGRQKKNVLRNYDWIGAITHDVESTHENKYTVHTDTNECKGMSKNGEKNEESHLMSYIKFILMCVFFFSSAYLCSFFFPSKTRVSPKRKHSNIISFSFTKSSILCAPFFFFCVSFGVLRSQLQSLSTHTAYKMNTAHFVNAVNEKVEKVCILFGWFERWTHRFTTNDVWC